MGKFDGFLHATVSSIRIYYVNVVSLCVGHVVLFADQRDRSGSVGENRKNVLGKSEAKPTKKTFNFDLAFLLQSLLWACLWIVAGVLFSVLLIQWGIL